MRTSRCQQITYARLILYTDKRICENLWSHQSKADLIWTFISPRFRRRRGQIIPARPNISILSRPWPRNCGNHLGPISREECDVDSFTVADKPAGCDLPVARQPLDTGKSALSSFRNDSVSSTALLRGKSWMKRY